MDRVMISGGGTGGHIFPAIAIADEIKKRYPDVAIQFVGAKGKMEMEKVPQAGYTIHGLWISGIQRNQAWKNISFPFKLISSLWKSRSLLKKFKPEVVIGVGGFASGPLLYAASQMNIPTLIQEQNNYPGITDKLLAKRVRKICTGFPGLERFFPKEKLVVTGNPIRKQLLHRHDRLKARQTLQINESHPTVLVTGGSLGARSINRAIQDGMTRLDEAGVQVIWQTGKSEASDVSPKLGLKSVFIKEMETAYAAADMVVARAGALTLAELCIQKKPSILIPLPTAAEDHQTANAKGLVENGAARLIPDAEASERLIDELLGLISDKSVLNGMSEAAGLLAKPEATQSIVDEIEKIVS